MLRRRGKQKFQYKASRAPTKKTEPLQSARNESSPSLLETSIISISTLAWRMTSKNSWAVSILQESRDRTVKAN